MGSGRGSMTVWTDVISLDSALKKVKMANFIMHISSKFTKRVARLWFPLVVRSHLKWGRM
jgi:hypothetical protein